MSGKYWRICCRRSVAVLLMITGILSASAGQGKNDWKSPHPLTVEELAPIALLPFPQQVVWGTQPQHITSTPGLRQILTLPTNGLERALKDVFPNILVQAQGDPSSSSIMRLDPQAGLGKEGYRLATWPNRFMLTAQTEAGLFYGLQTLRQMVLGTNKQGDPVLAVAQIQDIPAFPNRGFMHDVGRNFMPISVLKEHLDLMARFKINMFQWHLTDYPSWRIEAKKWPQLNDPQYQIPGRYPGVFYTYDEIRDLIAYAKERHIRVIPEIDMPGHSTYFTKTFGFTMDSPKGMEILESLLEEFCAEIPQEDCPWIHIGTDECHIKQPKEFVNRMVRKLTALGRRSLQWHPGLHLADTAIAQLWQDNQNFEKTALIPRVDSRGYMNTADPPIMVRRHFFRQPCGVPKADDTALGGIVCLWNDVRAIDVHQIERQNPMWPCLLTFAERSWKGGNIDASRDYMNALPPRDTEAFRAFELFEKRLETLGLSLNRPFQYWSQAQIVWKTTVPMPTKDANSVEATRRRILSGDDSLFTKEARGGYLAMKTRADGCGLWPEAQPGVVVWAQTEWTSEQDGVLYAFIGFDAPARSDRRCSGIPARGTWSNFNTKIWINGKSLEPPQWKEPGKYSYPNHTWFQPANEIPFSDEEFWWTRPPTAIPVKKGKNILLIENPYLLPYQNWAITFLPVQRQEGKRWISAPWPLN